MVNRAGCVFYRATGTEAKISSGAAGIATTKAGTAARVATGRVLRFITATFANRRFSFNAIAVLAIRAGRTDLFIHRAHGLAVFRGTTKAGITNNTGLAQAFIAVNDWKSRAEI